MMIDPTGITSTLSTLDTILKLTGYEKKPELKEKLEQAQRYIIDMTREQLSLMKKVANLERQLAEFQDWESQSNDCQLHSIQPGSIVVARKQDLPAEDALSITYFCPNCFQDRKLYPVQYTFNPRRAKETGRLSRYVYQCQKCKLQVDAGI